MPRAERTPRAAEFVIDAGEPAILLGTDTGPNPAEFLLHALAACLTTSIVFCRRRAQGPAHIRGVGSPPVIWMCAAHSASTTSPATGSSASACRFV